MTSAPMTPRKHIRLLAWSILRDDPTDVNCDECNTSCQSACKTSCTVASQICVKASPASSLVSAADRRRPESFRRGRRAIPLA